MLVTHMSRKKGINYRKEDYIGGLSVAMGEVGYWVSTEMSNKSLLHNKQQRDIEKIII